MKKARFFAPFIVAMMVLPYFSCKSAPAAQPPAPAKQTQAADTKPAPAASSAEMAAPIARAEAARQKVLDFEGNSYFPSDWEKAEGQFTQAKQQNNVAACNAAADAYESIFSLTIPLYAQAKEDEIMKLREDLIAAGIRDAEPEYFTAADDTALAAYDQYEAEDYYTARDTANKSIMMYQTLSHAYDALLVRNEIEEMNFASNDPDNFETAGELLGKAMDAYEEGDIQTAYRNSTEALRQYNEVLAAGWSGYAEFRSSLAEAERQAALDIKANIATKDLFTEADSNFKQGTSSFDSKQYKEAARQFINSEALFITASESTAEKRRLAADTIREANEKIEESAETARQAEIILEGGAE